jgi:uncharacterized integral membrane protein
MNFIMLSLVVAILFGLSITFFAFQNSILVPVTLGSFNITGTPLYLVVIASLLVGILMAWFISAIEGMSHFMSGRKKDNVIVHDKKEIDTLRGRVQNLEEENSKLRGDKRGLVMETRNERDHNQRTDYKPSIMERLFPSSTRHYSKQI